MKFMKKFVIINIIMLLGLLSGGCAVVPALVTTSASFAVPQTVSMAITAVGTAHKTVLVAADERDANDMISDKMLTVQAQAVLMTEPGADMDATCLNGDIYLVGEYVAPADRDNAIEKLQGLNGVNSVKGVVKQTPKSLAAIVEPAIADKHAEVAIEYGLLKELHIKSANVNVEMVQGEAVIVGVVRDKAEADAVTELVKSLRPKSEHQVKVTSLLAFQDAYESGGVQENAMYALLTKKQMIAATKSTDKSKVSNPVVERYRPSLEDIYAGFDIPERTLWQKARLKMKHRILSLAKSEKDSKARKELIILSSRVLKDKNISIEGRLVKTLNTSSSLVVKKHMDVILAEISPQRTLRIRNLAMN